MARSVFQNLREDLELVIRSIILTEVLVIGKVQKTLCRFAT